MPATGNFWMDLWEGIKRIPKKVVGALSSRKFIAAVGASVAIMQTEASIEVKVGGLVTIWLGFILATAYEDAAYAKG